MTLKQQIEEYDKHFAEINHLIMHIQLARLQHLDIEFLDTFLQDYLQTQNITQSINHALREWDL